MNLDDNPNVLGIDALSEVYHKSFDNFQPFLTRAEAEACIIGMALVEDSLDFNYIDIRAQAREIFEHEGIFYVMILTIDPSAGESLENTCPTCGETMVETTEDTMLCLACNED